MWYNCPVKTVLYIKGSFNNTPSRRKVNGITEQARAYGLCPHVVTCSHEGIRQLLDFWKPAGCIINTASEQDRLSADDFKGVPHVYIDRPVRELRKSESSIYHDTSATIHAAMRELQAGHPASYAYVKWPAPLDWDRHREMLFRKIAKSTGTPAFVYKPQQAVEDFNGLPRALSAWIAALPKPTGILCAADPLGPHVLSACQLAGLTVPDDVSVIGIDNDVDICENTTPTLSSVFPDHTEAGRQAVRILFELMNDIRHKPVRESYASPTLCRRGSTLRLNRYDRETAAACELIRLRACSGISSADVLECYGRSRRDAEYRFRAATGKSILEQIQDTRLAHARDLLQNTRLDLLSIALECGYLSATAFAQFFRRKLSVSPRAWRQAHVASQNVQTAIPHAEHGRRSPIARS